MKWKKSKHQEFLELADGLIKLYVVPMNEKNKFYYDAWFNGFCIRKKFSDPDDAKSALIVMAYSLTEKAKNQLDSII